MHYDVIVIGSGQAGVPLAARLAEAGRSVLIAERGALGGTCVNTGCTPTKTMVASARAAHVARSAARLGVHVEDVRVDLAAVVDRKDRLVRQWQSSVEKRLERAGERLTLARGHARFVGPRAVEVNGDHHSADVVVLNVGARAAVPPIEGLEQVPWVDNHGVMDLRELPAHLLVLGGSYIGCELGQTFRRFGADVTILDTAPQLLPREDEDVAEALEEALRGEGVELRLGAQVASVARGSASRHGSGQEGIVLRLADGTELGGSHLLIAVGRKPNTDDLGCDAAGIELDEGGFVVADDHYRTSAEGVYAVGDVLGGPQFTHTSWDDHRLLFDLLVDEGRRGRSGRVIPYVVFTDPQVGRVGLSEREAGDQGLEHEVASMPFSRIARAIETDEQAGIVKVLIDPESERILGAAIVGAEAGELLHVFVPLMQAGASARAIVDAQLAHPTFAEGLQTVLMGLDRFALGAPGPTARRE